MRDLVIRTICTKDFGQYVKLSHFAFGVPISGEMKLLQNYASKHYVLVAEVDDDIVSQIFIYKLGLWVEGTCLTAGGIAGVVTAPEYRGRGIATQMLVTALKEMYIRGHCVSMLFPATYSLYHRCGWSIVDTKYTYIAPPASFQPSRCLTPVDSGYLKYKQAELEDVQILQNIRHRDAFLHNCYVERDDLRWELVIGSLYEQTPRSLAIHYDKNDVPDGYIIYDKCATPDGQICLSVHDLVANTQKSLYDLMLFLSRQATISTVSVTLCFRYCNCDPFDSDKIG